MSHHRGSVLSGKDNSAEVASLQKALGWLEQIRLKTELPQALADGSLRLDYQPIVRLDDGEIMGFEALVRWPHPVRGLVPLAELNLVAEELGLSLQLTAWVITESCRRFGQWVAQHGRRAPELALYVNLPGSCVTDPGIAGQLEAALTAHGVPASRLVIEISESLCTDCSFASRLLGEIKALGARVAFDDFGTSSNSLNHLETMPVDIIKMDHSFVDRLGGNDNLERLNAVFNLASRLGVAVVAEGVTTEPQLALLAGLGCHLAQGSLFAGPCDDEAARALVVGERPWATLIADCGGSHHWCVSVAPRKVSIEGDSVEDWLLAACRNHW